MWPGSRPILSNCSPKLNKVELDIMTLLIDLKLAEIVEPKETALFNDKDAFLMKLC